ncbi:MAG: TIM barrel protein [Candidatus Zapsychrus exili]|nr:TIM barrel protein [Candidatus Zapsychrus exili]
MLAISTSWNYKPDNDIKAWLCQVKDLGIDAIEINYSITKEHLDQLYGFVKELNIKVVSVHNFCPVPDDEISPRHNSNYYRLSSLDEDERQKAVCWTKNTIDTAKKFDCPVVVLHAGDVDIDQDIRSKYLFDLYMDGKFKTEEFEQEKSRILKIRKDKSPEHIKALDKSFEVVCDYAKSQGIKIGLETRYYPLEIPNFDEIGYFLSRFNSKGMYYWHDLGHAEMNERLGIFSQKEALDAYKDKLIGVHIHGMKKRRDHKAPFVGDMNIGSIIHYFDDSVMKVIETHQSSYEEMKEAVERLKSEDK